MSLTSTINPTLPVQFSPLMSAVIRQNFQAAVNDINNIYSLLGGGAVLSVFGRTGAVAAANGDYSIGQITGAGALASLNVGTGLVSSGGTLNAAAGLATRAVGFHADGGGSAITTGLKAFFYVPYGCTINSWTLMADVSCSAVVDVWKVPYASFPPTVANSITGGAPPTCATAQKGQSASLGTWTTGITAGDVLAFNVNSNNNATRLDLVLKLTVT